MSLDRKNQRICRVPPGKDAEFEQSIPAIGSIYFRAGKSTVCVGDGETPGGQEFITRAQVLKLIEDANWKAMAEQEAFRIETRGETPALPTRDVDTYLSPSVFLGFSVTTSATGGKS